MSRFSDLIGAASTPAPKEPKKNIVKKVESETKLDPKPSMESKISVESDE